MNPIVCPDPATFIGWQYAMTQAGIALLVALGLFVVMAWAARAVGWRLRAACGVCGALALGASASSFDMRAWLDKAGVSITLWFPTYPQDCDGNGSLGGGLGTADALRRYLLGVVAPVEHWAMIDLAAAAAVLALMALCVVALARAARRRDGVL